MKLGKHLEHLQEDTEYVAAREELEPLFKIADDLIGLRLKRGWTQAELARRAGTHQREVSRLENALDNPTVESLQKLAVALDARLEIRLHQEGALANQPETQRRCKVCGRYDKFDFHLPDEIWRAAVPEEFVNRVVCLSCFDEFARQKGVDYAPYLHTLYFAGDRAAFTFSVESRDDCRNTQKEYTGCYKRQFITKTAMSE